MSSGKRRFIDTSIFLRFLTADLPDEAERCAALIRRIRDGKETAEVSTLVMAEVVWTLERFYNLSKQDVASKVSSLIKLKGLRISNKEIFLEALSLFTEKNINFTDAYIAVQMKRAGIQEIYSYDRDFNRLDQVRRVEP